MKKRRLLLRRRIFAVLFLVLQIVLMASAILLWSETPWIGIGMWLFSAVVIVYILLKREKRVAILPWIVLCLAFPLFGGFLYFTLHLSASPLLIRRGVDGLTEALFPPPPPPEVQSAAEERHPAYARLMRYLSTAARFPVYGGTEVTYLSSGEEMLAAMLSALRGARSYIFLEYFIVEDGVMWGQIYEVLKERASAGVEVRVLYDDVGCLLRLPPDFARQLRGDGIKCEVFNPFRPIVSTLHNHRDHRKIAVVDGRIAFTGGANLADEYINEVHPFGHWKDAAVCLRGEAARAFAAIFLQNYSLCLKRKEDPSPYFPQFPSERPPSDVFVQPYADSPLDSLPVGEAVYHGVIASARKYLYVTTPYFVVDDAMVRALVYAAQGGVDVRIVTPHIWDKRLVHAVTRSYYRELILGGVRVYEYSRGFIHSKTVVADGGVSLIGTANFDYRSLYYHFECGTVVYGEETAEALREDFLRILSVSREVKADALRQGFFSRLLCDLLRIFAPLM